MAHPRDVEDTEACHWAALSNMEDFYAQRSAAFHRTQYNQTWLDFGSGYYGAGRLSIEQVLQPQDKLYLYDPEPIGQPYKQNIHKISMHDILNGKPRRIDTINFSYVLCMLKDEQIREIFDLLMSAHPEAEMDVVDYTLQGKSREEIRRLLNVEAEIQWRHRLGDEEFYRIHTKFSPSSLMALMHSCDIRVEAHKMLDDKGLRMALAGRNVRNWVRLFWPAA